jgi:hypothetical protein
MNRRQALTLGIGAMGSSVLQGATQVKKAPKRILFICNSLGFIKKQFQPAKGGRDYIMPYYFEKFEKLREQFTIFSGLEHPGLMGTLHASEMCFLTSEPNAASQGFRNTISIDQVLKEQIGKQSRFPSLNLSLDEEGISSTDSGVMIPPIYDDQALYKTLFIEKSASEKVAIKRRLVMHKARIAVLEKESLKTKNEMGLESFYKNLNGLKEALKRQEFWLNTPPPQIKEELPFKNTKNADLMERMNNFLTCIRLAFETDLTKVAVLHFPFYNRVPNIKGIDTSWHRLTHTPAKQKQLIQIEKLFMDNIAAFLGTMAATPVKNGSLLDETIVLMGSNLGESQVHDPRSLPIVVAGGGFNHGSFIKTKTRPLNELFLSLTQRMEGVDMPSFKKTTSSLKQFN